MLDPIINSEIIKSRVLEIQQNMMNNRVIKADDVDFMFKYVYNHCVYADVQDYSVCMDKLTCVFEADPTTAFTLTRSVTRSLNYIYHDQKASVYDVVSADIPQIPHKIEIKERLC